MKRCFIGAAILLACHFAFANPPVPLADSQTPVDWWFAFKFNAEAFPACTTGAPANTCAFGGTLQPYSRGFSQQFVAATSSNPSIKDGSDCVGTATSDPVGATFNEIYNNNNYYVVWNDQFYSDPTIRGCGASCDTPWGHSKGILAWDDSGAGVVMQVTTPSWPGSGNVNNPRQTDGNTLGCVQDDNVLYSQHFFSLRLTKDDVVALLNALQTASVVTDPSNPQIVNNGGPSDIQALVTALGSQSTTTTPHRTTLSTGVMLIAKPSALHVPPWQMVSALLGGIPLRVATWWERSESVAIPSTTAGQQIDCWDSTLPEPGDVTNANSGSWDGVHYALTGGVEANHNHAKIGVSLDRDHPYAIFGDMNQEGALTGNCASSQNGRGGLFFVVTDASLVSGVKHLIGSK